MLERVLDRVFEDDDKSERTLFEWMTLLIRSGRAEQAVRLIKQIAVERPDEAKGAYESLTSAERQVLAHHGFNG